MTIHTAKKQLATLKFQTDQHEVIKVSDFKTAGDYVLDLMHRSDYEIAALLSRDKTVLDLGSNGGHGTIIVGPVCKQMTGVDVSPMAIKTAKIRHESDKVNFRLIDGLTLPFPDHSFDLITSFQVIEHLVDYEMYSARSNAYSNQKMYTLSSPADSRLKCNTCPPSKVSRCKAPHPSVTNKSSLRIA